MTRIDIAAQLIAALIVVTIILLLGLGLPWLVLTAMGS